MPFFGGALCACAPDCCPEPPPPCAGRLELESCRCGWPPICPIRRFKNGKVAVFPSSSLSDSEFSMSMRPSALPSASIISLVRPSSSSSVRPILFITSSTGFMCSSRAHFRQSPSFLGSPPSILVMNITATFFLQREQRVGCIVKSPVYCNNFHRQGVEKKISTLFIRVLIYH